MNLPIRSAIQANCNRLQPNLQHKKIPERPDGGAFLKPLPIGVGTAGPRFLGEGFNTEGTRPSDEAVPAPPPSDRPQAKINYLRELTVDGCGWNSEEPMPMAGAQLQHFSVLPIQLLSSPLPHVN